jgi:transposase
MQFITGNNRQQTYFATLEDQVAADNPVRLMDAFIDKLDLQKLGFQKTVHHSEGRPPYAPGVLLKLYLYGYLNKIRSSRKLEKECSRNIELQWLLQNLQPNYHTIVKGLCFYFFRLWQLLHHHNSCYKIKISLN